jgi:hypothetical protein
MKCSERNLAALHEEKRFKTKIYAHMVMGNCPESLEGHSYVIFISWAFDYGNYGTLI